MRLWMMRRNGSRPTDDDDMITVRNSPGVVAALLMLWGDSIRVHYKYVYFEK